MADGHAEPASLGAFAILRMLGEGSSGTVYLAEQAQPRRCVALKLLHSHGNEHAAVARARFEQQAVALGALHHPGIAGLIESGWTADGRAYLVLEYIDGPELLRFAESATLSRRQRVELLARVCDAIDHAHRRGVIHGDLKPANIRVDGTGAPRVLDFELANGRSRAVDAVRVIGTPAYTAPERARGGAATEASDVHALGLLLFELLTDTPALDVEGLSPAEARVRAAGAPGRGPRTHRSLRGDLQAIVDKATAAEPSRRYASAAALAEDLRRHLAALPIAARRAGALERSILFARRHRAPVALTGLVLGSLATALLLMLGATRRADAATLALRRLRADTDGLSDNRVLDELERRAHADLWPAAPERVPAMQSWLEEAHRLAPRPALIRALLDGPDLMSVSVGASVDARDGRLLRRDLEELLARLEVFLDPARGCVARIEARRESALGLDERTLGAHALEWQQCIDAVARSPRYGGLQLAPQAGLVPLGEDAASRCAEFAVDGTGAMPLRDPSTGTLRPPRAEDAIVLVLIPGGEHLLHAEVSLLHTPSARPEVPPVPYTVHTLPFLLGKYELTQAQWLRLCGMEPGKARNPCAHPIGWSTGRQPPVDGRHPVESISFDDAQELLRRFGLCLPEFQDWEVAARGGEGLCGAELGLDALDCAANVSDLRSQRGSQVVRTSTTQRLLDDGFEIHAPVGSFRPNPYGLYDTLGNVSELCDGDGLGHDAAARGHNFATLPLRADPAFLSWAVKDWAAPEAGVRPARLLEGVHD